MNIEAEKEASRLRVDVKRAEELAGRLFATQPGGSTLEQYMVAGLERWPGMSTDQHAAISRVLRDRIEGGDEVSRAQVVELKIWLRTKIKKQFEADPDIVPKAPDTFALAQEAGVASVSYDTFRTQYFYPIRDEVREELGIPKPVRKGGRKKGFKTTARQKADEKKEQERKEKAEAASAKLTQENAERAAEGGELLDKFPAKKRRKRDRRARPIPLRNTMSLGALDALAEGEQATEISPAAPDEKEVLAAAQGADQMERILENNAKQPPEEHSTEHHHYLREEYKRNRKAFERDDANVLHEPSLDTIEGEGEAAFPVEDSITLMDVVEGRVRAKIASMLKNQRASLSVKNEDGWIEFHRPEDGGVFLDIHANDLEAFDRLMEVLSTVLKPLLKV